MAKWEYCHFTWQVTPAPAGTDLNRIQEINPYAEIDQGAEGVDVRTAVAYFSHGDLRPTRFSSLQDALRKLGDEEWELVSTSHEVVANPITHYTNDTSLELPVYRTILFFKRPYTENAVGSN